MKRRSFTKKLTFGAGTALLAPSFFSIGRESTSTKFNMEPPKWTVVPDGSITFQAGPILIKDILPYIDQKPIVPTKVKTTTNSVCFATSKGNIMLQWRNEGTVVFLKTTLQGWKTAPHWVQPIGLATVQGIEKFFYQGLGFAGPSGWANLKEHPYKTPSRMETGFDENWLLESYLVSSMLASDQFSLSFGALDHNNYLQKTTLSNMQKRFGLINRHLLYEQYVLQCEFATENIPLPKGDLVLPEICFVPHPNVCLGMEILAQKIAEFMKIKPTKPPRYHWCSWYIKNKEFCMDDLQYFLKNVEQQQPKPEFQTIQIDDGYQKYYGDWLDYKTELWPEGLKPAFDLVIQKGYTAGIWIGPFMVQKNSKLFTTHPEWMLRKKDGSYIEEMGGDALVLDTSHPDAFAYIKSVFETMRQNGAKFYKTDFMDWGLQDSAEVLRHTPGKTSVQYYRDVLKMIRQVIGEESYWLACISPFAPFLGFADGFRVANDTTEAWSDNIINAFDQMEALQYANNVLFQTDPDVMYLSGKNSKFSESEILTFAYFCGIMGGSVNTSEWLNDPDAVSLWRFLAPSDTNTKARLPFWSKGNHLFVAVREYPKHRAFGVYVANIKKGSSAIRQTFTLSEIIALPKAFVFEWNHLGAGYLGMRDRITVHLKNAESSLFYISAENKAPAHNLSLGGRDW